jgi:hypothetical protein
MSGNDSTPAAPALQTPKKKGPKVLLTIFVIGVAGFLLAVLWMNWKKPRIEPEPLSPGLTAIMQNMPGTSDAMIYVGLKDIRESRFWNEALPDSLRKSRFPGMGRRVDSLMKLNNIELSRDLDTLLISFQRSGKKQQNFIGMAWGPFIAKTPATLLGKASIRTAEVAGHRAYALDSTLWVSPIGSQKMAIASSSDMLEKFFMPAGHLFERDSVTASLVRKTPYKSHFWFTLSSPQWTAGALQSITSKNGDVKSVGNLNRIRNITMSVKFGDGLRGESEWVYSDRKAAFFASSFLWGTIELSKTAGARTSEAARALLRHIRVHQNLESVIITTDLPLTSFRKTAQSR